MSSERNQLCGGPGNALIAKVRRVLWQYCRCRPAKGERLWLMTWEWAAQICGREESWQLIAGVRKPAASWSSRRKRPWPAPQEIASQYLLLCLTEMRNSRALRLPFRAAECLTPAVAAHLQANAIGGPAAVDLPRLEYHGAVETTGEEECSSC